MVFKNVKKELIDQNLTIKELAQAIDYSPEHTSGIVNGRYNSPKAKKMIAFVLRKDFDSLWTVDTEAQTETTA